MVAGLPVIATDILFPALGAIYGVACDSVTSLFQAMLDHLESCILQIHEQNSGVLGVDAAMDNDASPYIKSCKSALFSSLVNSGLGCCLLKQILFLQGWKPYALGLLGQWPHRF